ncbi:MAG: hypothetical protein JSS66_07180 [Armatimonadetes bacterium]|nr:hypothetical protein [Armatimonadota bacterium]
MRSNVFEITEDHLKLLKNACWSNVNCEFGAPAIDCKRPYGNSSGVIDDIADILGIEAVETYDGEKTYTREQGDYCRKLHDELVTVLEICCHWLSFQTGVYERHDDCWHLVVQQF